MKRSLFTLLISLTFSSYAQNDFWNRKPISVSYFGHYYFHPGLKIGTQYDYKSWEKVKERKKRTITKSKSLFFSPQVGFYVHPKNHSGLIFNVDVGYQRVKDRFGFYSAYSIGLASNTQFNSGTTYVENADGSIDGFGGASRTYFMPSVNLEFGQQLTDKMSWYSKFTFASKLFYNTSLSAELFLELGMKFNLGNR